LAFILEQGTSARQEAQLSLG